MKEESINHQATALDEWLAGLGGLADLLMKCSGIA
ncbi:hypothetical protein LPU83_pLPU83c_0425 (plasmid) [Rhizobium favelukesii]|uniref:Uncharacterized protein n=1 Tax=Rhizobium favelukesii TaxID=348824 RepID=W6RIJ8_9HYPH|nr:hypothetical protein LPU83_pLPU83c_0425 [Rhizobium favelukesii]